MLVMTGLTILVVVAVFDEWTDINVEALAGTLLIKRCDSQWNSVGRIHAYPVTEDLVLMFAIAGGRWNRLYR
ncbi:hypothetical protein JG687_00019028 [Phytophthora cactorum]|uniref:Uncharacterized protein n=2 Tax=Phytophthora TaxID=4783 RepID=A0A8J5I3W0_9STRA|nr:hypothetical protein GQ600_308 [Phytophthora cactorum]KAG6942437.1 hypothetical protein JG688_00018119 [Phytophthora aleatoria]KAG6942501.1 hypothetical protein JG687_00019028 [Phytophthora cactorum]